MPGNLRRNLCGLLIGVLFETLEVLDDCVPRDGAMNMAIDEALLLSILTPTLRLYRWKARTVSFGYFGHVADAEEFAAGRELVRRWTGGGMVPHGEDLTYSIMIPASCRAFAQGSRVLYESIHAALSSSLNQHGLASALTPSESQKVSEACFANPVTSDVMLGGVKIAGAAHRRTKTGLLHQGSVQIRLEALFGESFACALGATQETTQLAVKTEAAAQEIARQKYATEAWNYRR